MKKLAVLPALAIALLSACGSDDGSSTEPPPVTEPTAAPTASDAPDPSTASAPTTAPASTATTCDEALTEAETAITEVMDLLDQGPIDPDEAGAAFTAIGDVVGTNCSDEPGAAISQLIAFTDREGAQRSEASQGFANGFIPELCNLPLVLDPDATRVCETVLDS